MISPMIAHDLRRTRRGATIPITCYPIESAALRQASDVISREIFIVTAAEG